MNENFTGYRVINDFLKKNEILGVLSLQQIMCVLRKTLLHK